MGDVRPSPLAPEIDALADLVDKVVRTDLVDGQLGKFKLKLLSALARARHRNEVRTRPAAWDDLVRDAVDVEREVPLGRVVRGVDDRIGDDPIRHRSAPSYMIEHQP